LRFKRQGHHGLGAKKMQDLIFVAVTIAFFVLSLGYVHFCDRVK